jgi:hypothetical protein
MKASPARLLRAATARVGSRCTPRHHRRRTGPEEDQNVLCRAPEPLASDGLTTLHLGSPVPLSKKPENHKAAVAL